ncbi:MAG TPA: DUF362 domain-containing protein [Vicinamibacterales bacterium]|nr:DUF362 domain-containing protein [Vicinamibacterales bacterium]
MSSADHGLTRRDLLTGILGSAAAAATLGPRAAAGQGRARVVRVESGKAWVGDKRDPAIVAEMVNRGLLAFTGKTRPQDAWAQFVRPGTRVGLKINLLGRPLLYTAPEMTDAIVVGLLAAGAKPAEIIVWDRHASHFGPTRYAPGQGAHGERVMTGGQYDSARACQASGGQAPIDRIATEHTDVTVNLPMLKNHGMAGVTLALKNIAFGCYSHHRAAHGGNCDPFIAEAYKHYLTQTSVPVHILDATEACYDQGPQPGGTDVIWRENAIYVATDPVALDVVCRDVILEKQRAAGLSSRLSSCRHIETAAQMGLGVGDRSLIDLTTIKV